MAYETSNPVRKISQMGDSNSMWYYTDGDAIGTIDNDDYFLADYLQLTAGDIIIVNSGGSNAVVDILIVSVNDGGSNTEVMRLDGSTGSLLVASDQEVRFRDSDLFIKSTSDGQLDIDADVEVEINTPALDLTGRRRVADGAAAYPP